MPMFPSITIACIDAKFVLTIHWLSWQEIAGAPALRLAYADWQRLRRDAHELDALDWWARWMRLGASLRAVKMIVSMTREIDVGHVPHMAEQIGGAKLVELPEADHLPWLTNADAAIETDRVLATVLFTDIVGSTDKAAALGDRRWHDLLDGHNAAVRRAIARFRGREVDSVGDGFLATFDGPARGVQCARAIVEAVRPLGLEVRCGLHTGEFEVMNDRVGGIAVHIGARVAALAGASEILVSSTVKDLVAGSGLRFADCGAKALKGVPGEWHIFRVEPDGAPENHHRRTGRRASTERPPRTGVTGGAL